MSDRSQNAQDIKAVLFTMKLVTFTLAVNICIYCLDNKLRISDRDSRALIGRTRDVTSPIRIVGQSFAELEMDKTVHPKLYLPLSERSKHQLQYNISV